MERIHPNTQTIHLEGDQLKARSFILGNGSGLVVLLPVALNMAEASIVPHKWFGVSEFGRTYLEVNHISVVLESRQNQEPVVLSRHNQVAFDQELMEAVRTFVVDGVTVRERIHVPAGHLAGLILSLEADRPATFTVQPQFDMRYYQAFNTDFSQYGAKLTDSSESGELLAWNEAEGPSGKTLRFHTAVRAVSGACRIELLDQEQRFLKRTYLKDEHREKLIHKAYSETHDQAPDEAPIWDAYQTTVYRPANIRVDAPATLVYGFDEGEEKARNYVRELATMVGVSANEAPAATQALASLESAFFQTGNEEVDLVYNHMLTRFNSALVARDADLQTGGAGQSSAIFAGDKYFLDPWKRDENISLEALLATNDFETVRAILESTWEKQDTKTGRLPQILRLDEPTVYFSSDGTLWALRRLAEYTRMSGDVTLFEEKRELVEHFFEASLDGCRRGLLPSGGVVQEGFLWETWMDTAFTPRDGYPAEIELLWLTGLRDFLPLISDGNEDLADRMETCLQEGLTTFKLFHCRDESQSSPAYIADSLDYAFNPRELLTPNWSVGFGLEFPVKPDVARDLVQIGRKHLVGRVGVKSLAERDWPKVFGPNFLSDPGNVRSGQLASVGIYNYHRGIEWLWFNTFMVAIELQHGDADHAYRHYIHGLVRSALHKSGVAGLDELEDLHGPLGADFQAWSMAGFITAVRRFAGVFVDRLANQVRVCPQLPSAWPFIRSRHRVGSHTFAVEARRLDGAALRVLVTHDDPPDPTLRLQIGCRLNPGRPAPRVRLAGVEVSQDQLLNSAESDSPSAVWVEAPSNSTVTVEFLTG